MQHHPNCAWEGLGHIGQGRLREAGSIYVAMEKPSSLLSKDFPVLAFGGGTPTPEVTPHLCSLENPINSLVPQRELQWDPACLEGGVDVVYGSPGKEF